MPENTRVVVVPVEGTIVNWGTGEQVNPNTGQRFDFDGRLIQELADEVKPPTKRAK